jgi:hypothetical protein
MTVTKLLATSVGAALALVVPHVAFAQDVPPNAAQTPAPEAAADKRAEARGHFDLGVSHFDREEWSAALAEFSISRQLLVTKGNTKNSAICLRKMGRFADSLDLFESLVRDFDKELSSTERALAEREIVELKASVGTLEIRGAPDGASITIDGVDYGRMPAAQPLRLSVGSHSIRIVRDGFLPFESRLALAGREAAVVNARLAPLTQAGRLAISERSGKELDIVVDGSVVGHTPWEGALAPGAHTVLLRGPGKLGTQPAHVDVKVDQAVALALDAEELPASLSVQPTPVVAIVTIDEVDVAHGPWVGRLRTGKHTIAVRLDGYLRQEREVTLGDESNQALAFSLESAAPKGRAGLQMEIDGAAAIGLLFGGDVSSSCSGGCSTGVPVGFAGTFHGSYRFPSGWALGVQGGYTRLGRSLTGRDATLQPKGRSAATASVDDDLALGGLRLGPEGQYDTGGEWPVTVRLGLGLFVGSASDARTGSAADSTRTSFTIDTRQSSGATYLYLAPELRLGRRLGESLEVNLGVELLVMGALRTPKWDDSKEVPVGRDGIGVFVPRGQQMTGGIILGALPGIGAKLAF